MKNNFFHTIILPINPIELQKTNYDCGPASLQFVLNILQKDTEKHIIAEIARTSKEGGTNPKGLEAVLRAFNIRYEIAHPGSIELLEKKIRELNLCIVNYQAWARGGSEMKYLNAGHYSIVFGYNKTHFFVADPSKYPTPKSPTSGFRTIRKDLFIKRWRDEEENGTQTDRFMLSIPLFQN